MANRFFIPQDKVNKKEKIAVLAGEECKHAAKVMRFKTGDKLEFIDGQGNVYQSVILDSKVKELHLKIVKVDSFKKDYILSVFVGLPKGSKVDLIVRALTEAGATTIGMFASKYSDVSAKSAQKIERLTKISIEACKQSQRAWFPNIEANLSFDDLLLRVKKSKNSVVFYERASNYQPVAALQSKELTLIIGPEGGFDVSEVDKLTDSGALVSRLGDAVLRVETAAIAATGLARYAQMLK